MPSKMDASHAAAVEEMIEAGDHHLAARTVTWYLDQRPDSERVRELKKLAFLKLKERYQEFNPFKFIIYSDVIGDETPQLGGN